MDLETMLGVESIKLPTKGISAASETSLMPFAEKGVEKESRSGGKVRVLVLARNIESMLVHFTCRLHVAMPVTHRKVNGCIFTSML